MPPDEVLEGASLRMQNKVFERCDGAQVTDSMLQEASQLFSEHYGVWSEHAAQVLGKFAKAGKLAHSILGSVY